VPTNLEHHFDQYIHERGASSRFGFRFPPKRREWMSEDYRMGIFDAVALAWATHFEKMQSDNE
jgi:hypothetical protein